MDALNEFLDYKLKISIGNDLEYFVDVRTIAWSCSVLSIVYQLFWKKVGFFDMSRVKTLEPQKEDEKNIGDMEYSHKEMDVPVMSGWMLKVFRRMLRTRFGKSVLVPIMKKGADAFLFERLEMTDPPTLHPVVLPDHCSLTEKKDFDVNQLWNIMKSTTDFPFVTISDYVDAYRSGEVTPLQVAQNIIFAIKQSEADSPKMRIIIEFHEGEILHRAQESTERYRRGSPLSVFDGIPIAVKDEIYVAGYPCRNGTVHFDEIKGECDEGLVMRRFRAGGAVFIGMGNMHQLGAGVTGINPSRLHGTTRNPYNINHSCGGSSGGPAAAVASGLCPVALGTDGGGSVRIPAAACGVVGLKATYARISTSGVMVGGETVTHLGPLCGTSRDAAIAYAFMAGPDPAYSFGRMQPPVTIEGFENRRLNGIKIGVDWKYFNDCDPEIAKCCKNAVEELCRTSNASLVEISIPELQEAGRAHAISILSHMYANAWSIYHDHHDDLNTDVEMLLALGSSFSAFDYFQALKQRTRSMTILKRLFKTVDCIVTPVSGAFQPRLTKEILENGYSNVKHTGDTTRYANLGNLTGVPGISVTAGYADGTNLPIGIQFQCAWWREDLLLRIANSMESLVPRRTPDVFYDVLKNGSDDSDSD